MSPIKIFICLYLLLFLSISNAVPITCGSAERTASLDSATDCVTGLDNPKKSDIDASFTSDNGWANEGELTDDGIDQFLTAILTSGSWGDGDTPIEGDWSIAAAFWNIYEQAVISIHVGNGGGDPDHFLWLIEDGETSGTLSYERITGSGGGLSNIKLWGADKASNVPEPAIIALFSLGLIGLRAAFKSRNN